MTYEEAIEFIQNKIQIDVRFCSDDDIKKHIEVLNMACEALEKQKPKRVKNSLHSKDKMGGYCPNCNGTVEKRNTFLRRVKKENYCTWCGQALDWDGKK